jgi:AcrR family transcriptional regulator
MSGVRSYGGKTGDERAAEQRQRLVAATITVVAEQGAGRATMTAICATAGLTERYFYESFASVDEALVAALDDVAEEIASLVVSTLQATEGSAETRVHALMVAFFDLVDRSPATARMAVVESTGTPALRARRLELLGSFAELVAEEAVGLYDRDAWPAERARIHGLVYVAGLAELVGAWLAGEVVAAREELIEAAGVLFEAVSRRAG